MSELRRSLIPMLAAAAISHGEARAEDLTPVSDDTEILCIVDSINSGTADVGNLTCAFPVDAREKGVVVEDTNLSDPYIEAPIGYKFKLPCKKEADDVRTVFHCDVPSRYAVTSGVAMHTSPFDRERLGELTLDDVRPLDLVIDQNADGFVGSFEFLKAADLMDVYYNIINGEVARLEAEGVEMSDEFKRDMNVFAQIILEFGNPYYQGKYSNRQEYSAANHGSDIRSRLANLLMQLYLKDPVNEGFAERLRATADNWDDVNGEELLAFKKNIAGVLNIPMNYVDADLKLGLDNLISPSLMSAIYNNSTALSFDLPAVETSEIVRSLLEENADFVTLISGNEISFRDASVKTPRPVRYVLGNDGMFHCLSFKGLPPKTEAEFKAYLEEVRD
jgi:hypothetical protein